MHSCLPNNLTTGVPKTVSTYMFKLYPIRTSWFFNNNFYVQIMFSTNTLSYSRIRVTKIVSIYTFKLSPIRIFWFFKNTSHVKVTKLSSVLNYNIGLCLPIILIVNSSIYFTLKLHSSKNCLSLQFKWSSTVYNWTLNLPPIKTSCLFHNNSHPQTVFKTYKLKLRL